MHNSSLFRAVSPFALCLGFTGSHVAWADSRSDLYVEDPYAPHQTSGAEARLGTVVGFEYGEPQEVLALGIAVAGGHRFGRITIESELQAFVLRARGAIATAIGPGEGDIGVGRGERLAALARLDVIRFGPHVVGPNSLLSIYVEGGAAVAWTQWTRPDADQPARIVPTNTKRPEGQVGFGIALDHRLQEPIGFPHRVAWLIGWRLSLAPHQPMTATECRGTSCRPYPMEDDSAAIVDRSMLFQSSLAFTF